MPAQAHRGVELIPQHFDSQRVLPQQKWREEVRDNGLGDAGDRRRVGFAPPDEAGIGGQPHQQGLILRRIGAEMPAGRCSPAPGRRGGAGLRSRHGPGRRIRFAFGNNMKRLDLGNLHARSPLIDYRSNAAPRRTRPPTRVVSAILVTQQKLRPARLHTRHF